MRRIEYMPKNILIIDDEATLRDRLAGVLKEDKWHVQTAGDGASALKEVSERDFDLIICDLMLPDSNGIEILKKAKEINPNTLFIMITAYPTVENAVEAMKIGAKDYVVKPFRFDEIILRVRNLLYHQDVVRENIQLKEEIRSKYDGGFIIGKSPIMQKVYQMIDKVAHTDANVLITGESGTGKEVIAREIHDKSLRKDMRFLPINCGAIPAELIEGELFGFKKGTFTGAAHDRKGLFESADKSTIFLDEISTLPIALQPKLLRFIETKEVLPMGGREGVKVDVRIVAATNQSLDKEVDSVDEKVMGIFLSYPWKGNIRELENVIERAVIMCEGNIIILSDLPSDFISDGEESITNLKDYVKIHEKGHIKKVLIMANNDKKKAAELLDLSIPSLYRKIEELGI